MITPCLSVHSDLQPEWMPHWMEAHLPCPGSKTMRSARCGERGDRQRAGGGCRRLACAVGLRVLPWAQRCQGASSSVRGHGRDGAGLTGISRGGRPVSLGRGFGVCVARTVLPAVPVITNIQWPPRLGVVRSGNQLSGSQRPGVRVRAAPRVPHSFSK